MKTKQWQRVLACGIIFLATSMVNGQVMYNLRGGIMPGTVHTDMKHDEDATESRIDWMIGFELEIPIAKNWNIETGLRYKQKNFVAYKDYDFGSYWYNEDYLAKHPEEDFNRRLYNTYSNASILELPIRATYKFHLNDNFSLHLGFGPYASINLTGKPFDSGMPFKSSALSVGIEPSVALYYKNLSIGAIYNNPVIFQRHKEMDSNHFMITVGFRFGNKVFNSIGHALSKAEESGALDALGNALQNAANALGGGQTSSNQGMGGTYVGSSGSDSGDSSGNNSRGSTSSIIKTCKFCAGSGRCSGMHRCRGTGKCNYCNGQKITSTNGHYHECGGCHGTGKCSFCGGTGKCKHCGGTGKG